MPTHLIYEAWLKTKDAEGNIKQSTRDAKGNEIIRDIKFSDPIEHKDIEEHDGCCYLCGEVMSKGIKVKKVFSGRFTDWNSGNSRHSSHVCPSCSFCVLTSPTKSSLRMFSHVANKDKLHLTNRIELRDYLLKPPEPPFVINLAVSQKKHIAFKGEVNYSQGIFTVMYEEMPVIVKMYLCGLLNGQV